VGTELLAKTALGQNPPIQHGKINNAWLDNVAKMGVEIINAR